MCICKRNAEGSDVGIEARSSVGERYLDAVEVGGSIPPVPTIPFSVLMNF